VAGYFQACCQAGEEASPDHSDSRDGTPQNRSSADSRACAVTAADLTGVQASARALLAVAGMAGIGIAASPNPPAALPRGSLDPHKWWFQPYECALLL
jgi:hypothetical protein